MDFDRAVADIIERAKNELAELASKAALQQDFTRLAMLAGLAQKISEIADQNPTYPHRPLDQRGSSTPYTARSGFDSTPSLGSSPRATSLPRSGRAGYPRFHREGDVLVKIGWSKSDRKPYEHRSPFAVVEQLVSEIVKVGKGGARFTTEQLLPLKGTDGVEWPSYQVYLCIAWLVSEGLLDRYGRQGYTVKAADLMEAVQSRWRALS